MQLVYKKSSGLTDVPFTFCPGCTHGIIIKLIAESITELKAEGKTVGVASVGCSVLTYEFFSWDMVQAPHGRAPAVATGLNRTLPGRLIFTYQGDGDLAGIGMSEVVHAAGRGENICVFFVNNTTYGMTGGQMAPTSLLGQKTPTSPSGRDPSSAGYPIRMCELLATLDGVAYAERVAVGSVAQVRKAKRAIRKALQSQLAGQGFSFIEILSTCPTNWKLSPTQALDWLHKQMLPCFPLGIFKDRRFRDKDGTARPEEAGVHGLD